MPNFTIACPAMGSHIQAWVNVPDESDAGILTQVPVWFETWEARFSRFRPTSELCLLNADGGQWVEISAEMAEVIGLALKGAAMTGGLFNPLILPVLESAGYERSFLEPDFVPGVGLPGVIDVPDWRTIELDTRRRRMRLPGHARLDLGGIVKGWAAQRAADRLAEYGACLVNAGGDMAAHGSPDDSGGWQVGIPRRRESPEVLCFVTLSETAIATSGIDHRRWTRAGQTLHHLIDPRTAQPVSNHTLTATVIAPDAMQAEAWAKATLIAGGCALPGRAGCAALIVHDDLSVICNAQFEELCPTFNPQTFSHPAHLPSDAKAAP
ncbi:MAG: FAD:protein FMN transferase [Aggregatilineales bacterium]